jgi:hypothetical protein
LVYAILKILILVQNFISFIFQLFFGGRKERESLNSGVEREREKKLPLVMILTTKTIDYLCQMVPCDEKSSN